MARIEYWLQIENQNWDAAPNGIHRMTGEMLTRDANGFFRALPAPALLVRRYMANWASPDDQPLNAWDLTEPPPSQTHGTIPGATLEAKVGDEIIVHFRNMDMRAGVPDRERVHSFYAQGLQRAPMYDGTFPFSPPDPRQGNKQGDRVEPGESFDYTFTAPHLANAGAWLYYDASIASAASIQLGALGALIVRQGGESRSQIASQNLRAGGDTPTHFSNVPPPPTAVEHVLIWHTLAGVGDCLNGRQLLGNTPTLLARLNGRVKFRLLNLATHAQVFHLHGHRWKRGANEWTDTEWLAPGATATFEILEGTVEFGGSNGDWQIETVGAPALSASYVVTDGGALNLAVGSDGGQV